MTALPERVLDWRPNHDPRSMLPEHRVFGATPVKPAVNSRHYRLPPPTLDQDEEGACVGHGTVNACRIHPAIRLRVPNPQQLAFGMYYGSRRIDEWPGESHAGTSVNAGMKLARELGLISGWRWCRGAPEVRDAILLGEGPVVVGVPWTPSMYETGPDGLVTVEGEQVGGHCLVVTGFTREGLAGDYRGPLFTWWNSWGDDYGIAGHGATGGVGKAPFAVFDQLLTRHGEAAIPIP